MSERPLRIGLLGDDLSGVAALAGELGAHRWRTCVSALSQAPAPETRFWGINLGSRELDAASNAQRVGQALARLRGWGADELIVKIDSRWRGHPEAMIGAAAAGGEDFAIALPCPVPNQARIEQATGRTLQRWPEAPVRSKRALLIAGESTHERDEAIRTLHRDGVRLWVGGIGTAHAVARAALRTPRPTLSVVGSYHEGVAAQLQYLSSRGHEQVALSAVIEARAFARDCEALTERAAGHLRAGTSVVITTLPTAGERHGIERMACSQGVSAEHHAMWCFRAPGKGLAGVVDTELAGLILTGGQTAQGVLEGFGVQALEPTERGVAEGAPVCRAHGGAWSGLRVVTKPGHAGGARALGEIADQLTLLAEAER